MNIDDYESLPTTSVAVNMTAGAIAGVLEHIVMYPMDSIKTRMQSFSPSASKLNITATFQHMIRKEGILRPIRGVSAVVAGAGPAHALYFGTYEMSKELMTKVTKHSHINYLVSGTIATLIHDAVSNPAEVIKQRMQMYNSPYKSVIACMKGVYQKEGFKAFYRSYSTQLVMNLPNQSIHFTTYEFFQNMLNNDRRYNPPVHMIAGGAAGACAAAVTTPLDVVKTLLNTQETGLVKGMRDSVRQIYAMAGPLGFFKGLTPRVLYSMPATAICWSTYEFFKFFLSGMDREHYKSTVTGKSQLQPRKTAYNANIEHVSEDSDYVVLPVTEAETETKQQQHQQQITPPTPPPPTAGAIKSVCELSTSVTAPTLNLNTRHTEVKSPFDRGFST